MRSLPVQSILYRISGPFHDCYSANVHIWEVWVVKHKCHWGVIMYWKATTCFGPWWPSLGCLWEYLRIYCKLYRAHNGETSTCLVSKGCDKTQIKQAKNKSEFLDVTCLFSFWDPGSQLVWHMTRKYFVTASFRVLSLLIICNCHVDCTDMRRLMTGIRSEKCVVVRTSYSVLTQT